MEKYNALIKNWKHIIRYDSNATVQFNIVNQGLYSEHIGLSEIDLYKPLTKDEWIEFDISDYNATFLTDKELESLVDYLEYLERGEKY